MYSGFVAPKKSVARLGIHQRFDMAGYKMIEPILPPDVFPSLKQILKFEGVNGPDGLKVKSPGIDEPDHLYDPVADKGDIPGHITSHFDQLVTALKNHDKVRAAFEAAWMAHYICDGMTPAHHWPLEEKLIEAASLVPEAMRRGDTRHFAGAVKKNWKIWGFKGHMSTHFNFEMGIAFAMITFPIKPRFDITHWHRVQTLGPVDYFKQESLEIANLHLYEEFYRTGWTQKVARIVKNTIAPSTALAIGNIWLLAVQQAGRTLDIPAGEPGPSAHSLAELKDKATTKFERIRERAVGEAEGGVVASSAFEQSEIKREVMAPPASRQKAD